MTTRTLQIAGLRELWSRLWPQAEWPTALIDRLSGPALGQLISSAAEIAEQRGLVRRETAPHRAAPANQYARLDRQAAVLAPLVRVALDQYWTGRIDLVQAIRMLEAAGAAEDFVRVFVSVAVEEARR